MSALSPLAWSRVFDDPITPMPDGRMLPTLAGAPKIVLAAIPALFISSAATEARAQNPEDRIALKSGEGVDYSHLTEPPT